MQVTILLCIYRQHVRVGHARAAAHRIAEIRLDEIAEVRRCTAAETSARYDNEF